MLGKVRLGLDRLVRFTSEFSNDPKFVKIYHVPVYYKDVMYIYIYIYIYK